MNLIEVLSVVNENNTVSVFNSYDEGSFLLGYYDGKNSIDESLNDKQVVEILATENELLITIKEN